MATATSRPPAPMAIMPMPPPVACGCRSRAASLPGLPNRSRWTWWQMPLPACEKTMPYLARHGLQVAVVVGVLEADLDRVVVDVADRELGAHARRGPWPRTAGRPWCRWRPGSASGRCGCRSRRRAPTPPRPGAARGSSASDSCPCLGRAANVAGPGTRLPSPGRSSMGT